MLDVLIIGGGPHALTLATLLSNPDSEPELGVGSAQQDPLLPEPQTNQRTSKNCTRNKHKKRVQPCQKVEARPAPPEASGVVRTPPLTIRVVDSYGEWTALWESQFAALNIPHLRSHALVHTDPLNKKALQDFVTAHDRRAELHSLPDRAYILDDNAFYNDMRLGKKERRRLNMKRSLKKSLSLSLPGSKLSVDFFKDQVERYKLDRVLVKGTVDSITPVLEDQDEGEVEEKEGRREGEGVGLTRRAKYFRVLLQGGITLEARRVVVATGPTRAQMANIPAWVGSIAESYPEEHLQHTAHLMHHLPAARQQAEEEGHQGEKGSLTPGSWVVCSAGQKVMVVGGGLTSAHIVSIAVQQGASHVTWVMRKHLQLKQFDVGDVEGLVGRYSHVEHGIKMDGQAFLRQFYNERSLQRRLAMIQQARKGGAVTPEAYVQLQPFIRSGRVDVKTYCQVSEAKWCYRNQVWSLALSTGDSWSGDRIWLATGCKLDARQDPLLSGLWREFPIQVIDGWPCIAESLQWAPGCPLYLMGQYTALQVGPHAVNLAGGQAASTRISKDILRRLQPHGGKARTEEYVQQMRGLLWL